MRTLFILFLIFWQATGMYSQKVYNFPACTEDCKYNEPEEFKWKLVNINNKLGIVSASGKTVVTAEYDSIKAIHTNEDRPVRDIELFQIFKNGKGNIIDTNNKILFNWDPGFIGAYTLKRRLSSKYIVIVSEVQKSNKKRTGKTTLYKSNGKKLYEINDYSSFQLPSLSYCDGCNSPVFDSINFNYIRYFKTYVYPYSYYDCVIDTNGKELLPPKLFQTSLDRTLFIDNVGFYKTHPKNEEELWGLVDGNGNKLTEPIYSSMECTSTHKLNEEFYYIVTRDINETINKKDTTIFKSGIINKHGKVILQTEYDDIEASEKKQHLFKLTKDGKSWVADIKNNTSKPIPTDPYKWDE